MSVVTPHMNLSLPTVSDTVGPTWAETLNEALGVDGTGVDGHDHTDGKGVPITPSALNLNADVDFQGFDPINVGMVQFEDQEETLDEGTSIYFLNGDLYVNDGNDVSIRITENGAISAASFGGITGLVSPASASFATDTFTWLYDTGKYALMASGPLHLRRDGETSPHRVKITPPATLAAAYDLTLPAALPASNAYLYSSLTGATAFSTTALASSVDTASIQSLAVTEAKIGALAVTRAKQAVVGQQVSSSCGAFDTASLSMTAVTNLNVTLTITTTRPIVLMCVQDGAAASYAGFTVVSDTLTYTAWRGQIAVSNAETANIALFEGLQRLASTTGDIIWPPSTLNTIYVPGTTGTFTFTVQVSRVVATSTLVRASYMKLVAYQL